MEIERRKIYALKNLVRSFFLLIICTPLLFGALIKLLYSLPQGSNSVESGLFQAVRDIISRLYHGYEFIQFLWPISPTPSLDAIVSFGNVATLLLFFGFLWGILSFQLGIGAIDDLGKAKSDARRRKLESEYRSRE